MAVYDGYRQPTPIKKEDDDERKSSRGPSTPAADPRRNRQRQLPTHTTPSGQKHDRMSTSGTPVKSGTPQSPAVKPDQDVVGGEITVKAEPGQTPKLSRSTSRVVPTQPRKTFFDKENKTEEACKIFTVIDRCEYANKDIGTTEHALECECTEQWDSVEKINHACDENSDCINRATKLECLSDCNCGANCQNRRFQKKQYADVSVFKTEKKGYGLRANTALQPGDFIFEYIGEVIGERDFRRRMVLYDKEGQKHFYFMSLNKGEFVDATKRGNLGRFCNHSCRPNCYVDKWVVGQKLRMGIFAQRNIVAGEELVFNYNVDRYGANPQECFCGEPNCTGFIGGRTQTERGTKLSALTIEALGLEDGDDWDVAVAKKVRKKKTGEDDEEYVDSVQPRSLDETAVTKVMASLMQCKEKWIAVKLLRRIQESEDERVYNRVVRMHGYRILKAALTNFIDQSDVVLQVLDVLNRLPRLTRNKIQDSKIEETVQQLEKSEEDEVREKAESLMKIWSQLEMGYRIPRMKRDPNAPVVSEHRRRSRSRSRSRTRSLSPAAPRGPNNFGSGLRGVQRPGAFGPPRPRPFPPRQRPAPLPDGWFEARSPEGKIYYYSANGQTTWQRPTVPAQAPPPPPKAKTEGDKLMDIVNGIIAKGAASKAAAAKQQPVLDESSKPPSRSDSEHKKEHRKKEEAWRKWDETKQKRAYESTIFPAISHVVNKYKKKLPRDDLKKFAKDCAKFIVAQDFKKGRVKDPMKISPKAEVQIKQFTHEFFDKAVKKRKLKDKQTEEKANAKLATQGNGVVTAPKIPQENGVELVATPDVDIDGGLDMDLEGAAMDLSDNDDDDEETGNGSSQISPDNDNDLKRKREADETPLTGISMNDDGDEDQSPQKMLRSLSPAPPAPPPPPPPAEDDIPMDLDADDDTITEAMENLDSQVVSYTPEGSPSMRDGFPSHPEEVGAL